MAEVVTLLSISFVISIVVLIDVYQTCFMDKQGYRDNWVKCRNGIDTFYRLFMNSRLTCTRANKTMRAFGFFDPIWLPTGWKRTPKFFEMCWVATEGNCNAKRR